MHGARLLRCAPAQRKVVATNAPRRYSLAAPQSATYLDVTKAPSWVAKPPIRVIPDFVTQEESDRMVAELDPLLSKREYETSHWDAVIVGYREIERSRFTSSNFKVIKRVLEQYPERLRASLQAVHILDLAESGYIKPHVDSIKFSGDLLSGLCLLSPALMELTHEASRETIVAFLPSRCLYVMTPEGRYQFAHSIHAGNFTWNREEHKRARRISLMFRDAVPDAAGAHY